MTMWNSQGQVTLLAGVGRWCSDSCCLIPLHYSNIVNGRLNVIWLNFLDADSLAGCFRPPRHPERFEWGGDIAEVLPSEPSPMFMAEGVVQVIFTEPILDRQATWLNRKRHATHQDI